MMKLKKTLFQIALLLVCLFGSNAAYASEIAPYSYSYNDWLSLSEEAKSETILRPYSYEFNYTSNKASIDETFLVEEAKSLVFPSRFTLGNVEGRSYLTPIKDQGTSLLCWAFAGTTAVESNIRYLNKVSKVFNPFHASGALSYTYYDLSNEYGAANFNAGGNFYDAVTYWTSGLGPYTESFGLYKKTLANTLNDNPRYSVEQTYSLGSFNNYSATAIKRAAFIEQVKTLVMTYGAVYFQAAAPDVYGTSNVYYNTTYSSVYTDSSVMYNNNPHAMVIIGWDDNFSKEKFNKGTKGTKPSQNGAWIVQNSWGTGLGDGGFNYYSYEDYVIGNFINGVIAVKDVDYNNIYQYNPTGDLARSSSKYGANVFNKRNKDELLTQISFYVLNPNTQVNVYVNSVDGSLNSTNMKKITSKPITIEFAGFYTYELEQPITLSKTEFAVMIDVVNNQDFVYNIPLQSYMTNNNFQKELVGIMPNQSFTSLNGTKWNDQYTNGHSVFIKAYTEDINALSTPSIESIVKQNKIKSGGTLLLETFTKNIGNGTILNYRIKNSSSEIVTNKFQVKKNNLINGKTLAVISATSIPDDIYTIEITSGSSKGSINFSIGNVTPTLSVAIDKITVGLNQSRDIKYLVNNPSGLTLTYKTSNNDVVTITNGIIKGVNYGTAKITINNIYTIDIDVSEPVYISKPGDFDIVRSNLNGYYILSNDIDFKDILYFPIGTSSNPFTGILDGKGYTIKNLAIYTSSEYTGLFGNTKGAFIHNLTVMDSSIVGKEYTGIIGKSYGNDIKSIISYNTVVDGTSYVGGILGYANYTSIDKVINMSEIYGELHTGGIVGYSANTIINNANNQTKITGTTNTGGISGYLNNVEISSSNNSGKISGTNNIGGIVGYGTSLNIKNCSNNADVTGNNSGGIIGYILSSSYNSLLDKTYNSGIISGTTSGAIIGNVVTGNYTISNNYSFTSNDLFGTTFNETTNTLKKSSSTITNQTSYSNFDFSNIWYINNYAKLQSLKEATGILLEKSSYTINVGESLYINATASPQTIINKVLIYQTTSPNITLSGNKVTAKSTGDANIIIRTTNGVTKNVSVKVIDELNSQNYKLRNNMITKVSSDLTIIEFTNNILKNSSTYQIYKDGNRINNNNILIGTNTEFVLTSGISSINYIISVSGDVNGDGQVNVADLVKINRYILGLSSINIEAEKIAADVTEDNKVLINDLVKINRYILELIGNL